MKEKNDFLKWDPSEAVERRIFLSRGYKVILDNDLATLYGVSTKRLNEQVKRNLDRFPADFMFRLTAEEVKKMRSQIATASLGDRNLRSQFATSSSHGGRRYVPYVFTEHGALMAANILNSSQAIRMSIYVIRAFIRMREAFVANQVLERRLAGIEKVLLSHDGALRDLYEKLRPLLLAPPGHPKRRIGFHP